MYYFIKSFLTTNSCFQDLFIKSSTAESFNKAFNDCR